MAILEVGVSLNLFSERVKVNQLSNYLRAIDVLITNEWIDWSSFKVQFQASNLIITLK